MKTFGKAKGFFAKGEQTWQRKLRAFSPEKFINTIDIVKAKKGDSDVAVLRKEYGNLDYVSFRWYSMDAHRRINDCAVKILYNISTPTAQFQYGKEFFNNFVRSIVGKTVLAFSRTDFKRILQNAPKMWHLVSSSEVTFEHINQRDTNVTICGDAHDPESLGGVLEAFTEFIGYPSTVTLTTFKPDYSEYFVRIDDPNGIPMEIISSV